MKRKQSSKPLFDRKLQQWRRSVYKKPNRLGARAFAWFDMLILDHGFLRALYSNRHQLAGGLERCSQPSPAQIAKAAKRGVRTVVNLRGASDVGSYLLEKRACQAHGMKLVDFRLKARRLPTREQLLAIGNLWNEVQYPVLIHCKSGADRAGLMAALYLIFHRGEGVEQAMSQLSLRYGHVRASNTGMLDFLFASFLASGAESFSQWVENDYHPKQLEKLFRPNGWMAWFVDKVLRRE